MKRGAAVNVAMMVCLLVHAMQQGTADRKMTAEPSELFVWGPKSTFQPSTPAAITLKQSMGNFNDWARRLQDRPLMMGHC